MRRKMAITLWSTKPATERAAGVDSATQAGTGCYDGRSGSQTAYEHLGGIQYCITARIHTLKTCKKNSMREQCVWEQGTIGHTVIPC